MLSEGKSNAAIAEEPQGVPRTVKANLTNIYRKVHVANLTMAALGSWFSGISPEAELDVRPCST